jgi:hypothetical protein
MKVPFAEKHEAPKRAGWTARNLLAVTIAAAVCSALSQAEAATLTWSGVEWNVKSGTGLGPGVNNWSPANAFVDASGDLHLAVTKVNGTWYCGEVSTTASFGFGTYQWQLKTAVDNFDPSIVLGLLAYGPPAQGPDGTHEIDIEYSRFGSPVGDNERWTIFPNAIATPPLARLSRGLVVGGDLTTTSRFTWASTSVAFGTLAGFQPPASNTNLINSWVFGPTDPGAAISQSPMPVHMNLYLYNGAPPTNGQGTEVVFHAFSFTPAVVPSAVPALPRSRVFILAAFLIGVGLFLLGRPARRA